MILRTPTKELVSSYQKHVPEFTAKLVATPKYATSTEQTISVTVNKGDDVGNHIEHKPCRKDKRSVSVKQRIKVIQSQKNCQCLNHILWRKKFKIKVSLIEYTCGYGTVYKAWRKEDGITCYLGVLLSKVTERFRACPDLWDPWILKKPISSFKKDVIDRVRVKGTPKDKSNSSNDVWEDWSAASINWEISDNDEENCERMTMQAASGATECESKGEHDVKIFDITVDTSLASPATPNTIVSIKCIAKIGKSSSLRCTPASNIIRAKNTYTCKKNGMVSHMILQAASHTSNDMSGDYVSGMDVDVNVSRPFAMAQAAHDGLQLDDQIVKFGDVEYGDNLLPKLASEAQKN
ncbi:hypothetical protein Tco_0589335 [Tanacetum coccineum]